MAVNVLILVEAEDVWYIFLVFFPCGFSIFIFHPVSYCVLPVPVAARSNA